MITESMLEIIESAALNGWIARDVTHGDKFHLSISLFKKQEQYTLCGKWFKKSNPPTHKQKLCRACERIARAMYQEEKDSKNER